MKGEKKKAKPTPGARKPYQPPRLEVHGNLGSLTRVKGSDKVDAGKPATRASGPQG